MKIVRCPKCGKYIHKADSCFHCGNSMNFDDIDIPQIHENVLAEFSKIESLIESKRFDEAYSLSHKVIEWMPNFSGIFWLRLLAKNKCTSTSELIEKGFNCEDDSDLNNALTFSTGVEHSVYVDIQDMVNAAKKALKEEIAIHEYNCKMKTDVLQIKKNMKNETDSRKQRLFSLWSDLERTEQALYSLEMDCRLLSKEHSEALDKAVFSASSIKVEVYRLEECTAEDLHKYQVKIGNILQLSEQAKAALESMKKKHPWIHDFNDLVKKRDEQVRLIGAEISSLRSYEAIIQQTLDEIDRIEERHRKANRAVEAYDFLDAANLLGKDCYNKILHNIGLGIDVQTSISSQDWQPSIISASPIDDDDDEEEDTDDYYSAWGLPNDNY